MVGNILRDSKRWLNLHRRGVIIGALVGGGIAAYYISTHPDINFLMSMAGSRGASLDILEAILSSSSESTVTFTKITIVLVILMGLIGGLIESMRK